MKTVDKITDKIRRDGLRGAAAAGIRRVASAVDKPRPAPKNTIPRAWSDYLTWLNFAVPGMLSRGNVDAMSFALQHLPNDAPMLEIGSFCGLSTCVISYLRMKHSVPNRFFTCDRWSFEHQELGSSLGDHKYVTHDEYRTFVRDSYLRNTKTFCKPDLPHTIEADSDGFFQRWSAGENATDVFGRNVKLGGPLSFCYIDGNHTYEFAKRDFENTDRLLAGGGTSCSTIPEMEAGGKYAKSSKKCFNPAPTN